MSRLPTLRRSQPEITVEYVPRRVELRQSATQYAGSAREWATPRVESTRAAAQAKVDDLVPRIATAVGAALLAAEPVRDEVLKRGTAAIAALKGEVAPPKRRRRPGRKLFVLLAVLAGAAAGWKAWAGKSSDDEWQNQWASTPSTTSSTSTATAGGTTYSSAIGGTPASSEPIVEPAHDAAAGSPDELLADAGDTTFDADRTVTTPDDPADVTVIGDGDSGGSGAR